MNNKIFANTQRRAWLVPIALAPLLAGEIIFIKGPVLVGMGSSTSSQGPSAALGAAAHTAEKRA